MRQVIAETRTFQVGRFTVHQRVRPDNPFWPVYIVTLADRIVGRNFSQPNEGDCEWLLRHPDGRFDPIASLVGHTDRHRGRKAMTVVLKKAA